MTIEKSLKSIFDEARRAAMVKENRNLTVPDFLLILVETYKKEKLINA